MKIPIKSAFYEDNKCVEEIKTNAIKSNDRIIYNIDGKQNIIYTNPLEYKFIRVIDESKFIIDLKESKAYIKLNEKMTFDVNLESLLYEIKEEYIMIEYKIETEDSIKKLIIRIEE